MMGLLDMLPRPLQGERGAERRAASVFTPMSPTDSPLSLTSPGSSPGSVCPSPPEGGEGMGIVQ